MANPNRLQTLGRRDFGKLVLAAAGGLLVSCAPQVSSAPPVPGLAPSATPEEVQAYLKATLTPEALATYTQSVQGLTQVPPTEIPPTKTPEPTNIPKVTIDGIGEVTQQESAMFKVAQDDYRRAFKLGADQALPFTTGTVKDCTGRDVDFALMTTPDGKQLPVMIHNKETKAWEKATLRALAEMKQMSVAAPLKPGMLDKGGYGTMIAENVNVAVLSEGIDSREVFGGFTTDTWRSLLKDWNNVKAQLDKGTVPAGYKYNWDASKKAVAFAQKHNMSIVGQHLLWPDDVMDSIYQGNFTPEELAKILEFTVKTKVLQYKGQVQEWEAEAESVLASKFMDVQDDYHKRSGLWLRNLGGLDVVAKVAAWAKEADPSARLRVVEDHIMEKKFGSQQPAHSNNFFNFLQRMKDLGAPIDSVDIENNLWVYSPPAEQYMTDTLNRVKGMGYQIATPETTVITSKDYPIWFETPPAPPVKVDDPVKAQADLYRATLRAYLKAGTNTFGFGDISDAYSWLQWTQVKDTNAMILDSSNKPKQAYYAVAQTLFDYASNNLG